MSKKIFFLLLIVGAVSCFITKPFQQSILKEASSIHQEAQKIGEKASTALEELIQQANSIQVQGRQLTRSEIEFIDQVNNLRGEFQNWEYGEFPLPSVDSIRLRDKASIIKKQSDWKQSIEKLFDQIKQI